MTYRFDLVAERGHLEFPHHAWDRIRFWLSEFQPASKVSLVREPPSRIQVIGVGEPAEVAPGLLARIEELAGTRLRVEMLDDLRSIAEGAVK